jgi:hypothetical protein
MIARPAILSHFQPMVIEITQLAPWVNSQQLFGKMSVMAHGIDSRGRRHEHQAIDCKELPDNLRVGGERALPPASNEKTIWPCHFVP